MKKYINNFKEHMLNENEFSQNDVISFLNKQMIKDKKEYTGHIPSEYNSGSKWSDLSWIYDEILAFLNKDYTVSYTLRFTKPFSNKYTYDELDEILKNNFKSEYEYVLKNFNSDEYI